WRVRLGQRGIAVTDLESRFGDSVVSFCDRSGLTFELIAADDARAPWSAIDAASAIRGLHSVTMTVRERNPTIEFMRKYLGYTIVDETDERVRVAVSGGGPGKTIDIVHHPSADLAVNGLGTVHHVAMAVENEDVQLRYRQALIGDGFKVTEVRDRCYFKSIYFREPGGVLFEIATMQPGFAVDEDVASLGRGLKLPPWEEQHRGDIEAHLSAVSC
ncbi:MAG TPA: VOC family protein, partial [Vicinamibacterales bacterium]|nr:VOC family protein [Vicinamibacterales bacterium]